MFYFIPCLELVGDHTHETVAEAKSHFRNLEELELEQAKDVM
jgi:hypothetical protein